MKKLIRSLTLPMLVRMVKHAVRPPSRHADFASALAACNHSGYEDEEIVAVVVKKTAAFKAQIKQRPVLDTGTIRTLIGAGLANSQSGLHVLDFGGGAGYHFAIAERALGQSNKVSWCVVETPAMVQLARSMEDERLRFADCIDRAQAELGHVDLVFTSGALQYCPDPLAYLQRLVDVGARHLYITRTELTERSEAIVSVQTSKLSSNGPGALPEGFRDRTLSYPITHVPREAFERILRSRYEIRFTVDEDGDTYRIGDQSIHMRGYFCEIK